MQVALRQATALERSDRLLTAIRNSICALMRPRAIRKGNQVEVMCLPDFQDISLFWHQMIEVTICTP